MHENAEERWDEWWVQRVQFVTPPDPCSPGSFLSRRVRSPLRSTTALPLTSWVFFVSMEDESAMRVRTFAAMMVALLLASPLAAQELRGSIEGVVRDASGAVLPGATVEAKAENGAVLSTTSDAAGNYRFPAVAPGTYVVTATLASFAPGTVNDVPIGLGQVKKVDFALALQGVTESVQVTAESPLVDVRQSARQTNIRAEQVELLPKGRDFTSLVTQAPGANREARLGGLSIDGASASENRYIIDGIETTNLQNGLSGKDLIADFVEEVQVKSSGYTAEYGGATGGVVNAITKSGSNDWRGSALFNFEGDTLSGGSVPAQGFTGFVTNTGVPTNRLKLTRLRTSPSSSPIPRTTRRESNPGSRSAVRSSAIAPGSSARISRRSIEYTRNVDPTTSGNPGAVTTVHDAKDAGAVRHWELHDAAERRAPRAPRVQQQLGAPGRTPPAPEWHRAGKHGLQQDLRRSPTTRCRGTWTGSPRRTCSSAFAVATTCPTSTTRTFRKSRCTSGDDEQRRLLGRPVQIFSGRLVSAASRSNTKVDPRPADARVLPGRQHAVRELRRAAPVQGRRAGRSDRQRRAERRMSRNLVTCVLDSSFTTRPYPTSRGPFGYYTVRSNGVEPKTGFITQGDISTTNIGLFFQDRVDDRQPLHGERSACGPSARRVPTYTTGVGHPGDRARLQLRRQVRAARRLRLRHQGGRPHEGVRQLGHLLRHLQARAAARLLRRRQVVWTTRTRSTRRTGRTSSTPPAVRRPAPARNITGDDPIGIHRLPSALLRRGCDRSRPEADEVSRKPSLGIDHQLNDVMAIGVRYVHKQIDRAVEDTGFITADGSEGYVIANPGEGITKLAFPAGRRAAEGQARLRQRRVRRSRSGSPRTGICATSYTWSRLYGNYSGLSQSDESGRTSPNVGRLLDHPTMMFDQHGQPVVSDR